jgi:hypothetical protein
VVSGRGSGFAPDGSAPALAAALDDALACRRAPWPALVAPALPGLPALQAASRPVPSPAPWWRAPWVWALAAGLAVGAAGALVAARASAGPPDAVSLTLVPRP